MRVVDFTYPQMYLPSKASHNISTIRRVLFELYDEYVALAANPTGGPMASSSSQRQGTNATKKTRWGDFDQYCDEVETSEPHKSELVDYLDKPRQKIGEDLDEFDCLGWWKINRISYPVLSRIACDILAIPITIVASEATFSAGTRVIDTYRAALHPETVQVLILMNSLERAVAICCKRLQPLGFHFNGGIEVIFARSGIYFSDMFLFKAAFFS
ncbi:zinc finger BED domain-containing protein RICESLEEPER 2-like [Coffea arabica]|uniref:Zinc finger BED domain-containing protein RICESLEEPER 2-like n=1 Tax=Coffea arabica TaxID=13443 RepID=A0ABM4U1A9_COFAR